MRKAFLLRALVPGQEAPKVGITFELPQEARIEPIFLPPTVPSPETLINDASIPS